MFDVEYVDTLDIKWIVIRISWRVDFSVRQGIAIVSIEASPVLVDACARYTELGEESIVGLEVRLTGIFTVDRVELEDHFRID